MTAAAKGYASLLGRLWDLRDAWDHLNPSPGHSKEETGQALLHALLQDLPPRMRRAHRREGCARAGCSRPLIASTAYDELAAVRLGGQLQVRLWGLAEMRLLGQVLQAPEYAVLYDVACRSLCLPHGAALSARHESRIMLLDKDRRCAWAAVRGGGLLGLVLGPCGGVVAVSESPLPSPDAIQRWAEAAPLGSCGHENPGTLCRRERNG